MVQKRNRNVQIQNIAKSALAFMHDHLHTTTLFRMPNPRPFDAVSAAATEPCMHVSRAKGKNSKKVRISI
jgi:hypothetical protein